MIAAETLLRQRGKLRAVRRSGHRRSIYLTASLVAELEGEAERLDRSMSWLIRRAWEAGRERIRRLPSMPRGG